MWNGQMEDRFEDLDTVDIPSAVLAMVRELLGNPEVTLQDDFFFVGGDSIAAMHLVRRLARRTGLRLRVSQLFAHPTLDDFAAQVDMVRAAAAGSTREADRA
ncbi:acyl carrier protein [Streptomyces sp. rh34]|uniref:acyl carrier protein n=1 Tax=Streptomyces sp. rh34 TaxID=2034272 RepID=UPI000BEF60D3|nr:acyl carrier protein [Streptomyces sp. rh34]